MSDAGANGTAQRKDVNFLTFLTSGVYNKKKNKRHGKLYQNIFKF